MEDDSMSFVKQAAVFVFACAMMLAPHAGFAQSSGTAKPGDKESLMKASEALIAAEVAGDKDAMNRIFTADFVHIHASNEVMTRQQYLDSFQPRNYANIDLRDERVNFYLNGTLAVIDGHSINTNIRNGVVAPPGNPNAFVEVWVIQNGQWRLAQWIAILLRPLAQKPAAPVESPSASTKY